MAQKSAEPVTSLEHIPRTEEGRKFPPFDSQTFASQLLWLALTFIALYLLTRWMQSRSVWVSLACICRSRTLYMSMDRVLM